MVNRKGVSYQKRVEDINRIYDREARKGLPNRVIWRRFIYPVYGISERTFYNILKASASPSSIIPEETRQLLLFTDEELNGQRPDSNSPNYKDDITPWMK